MMYCHTSGNGHNIVLIHGFCENSTCFKEQVLLLKGDHSVTVLDLPGVGQSPYAGELSIEALADMVHETLQQKGLKDYVMLGHSMGGYITLAYAKKYAAGLKGFGLIHSTANPDNEERKKKRDQAIAVIREKGFESYVKSFVPPMFAPGFKDRGVIDAGIEEALKTTGEALISFLTAMKNREDSNDLLKATPLPVMFIAGKQDALIPEDDIITQSAFAKQSQLTQLVHSGHMGMLEEPQAMADAIRAFTAHCNA